MLSIHERREARRTSLRRPRDTAGMGGQPGRRPATALQMWALEQCSSFATSASVSRSNSASRSINALPGAVTLPVDNLLSVFTIADPAFTYAAAGNSASHANNGAGGSFHAAL